jgi:hypothetical protein
MNSRRNFLSGLLTASLAGRLAAQLPVEQNPIPPQEKRMPGDTSPETPALNPGDKRILEENEKDIKKKVEKLFELATELKAEVEKTDSSKVLSLNVVRKAEEIEKLARDIKNRSKG